MTKTANKGGLPVVIPTTTKTESVFMRRREPTAHLPLLDPSTLPSTTLMRTLARALTLKRDYGSHTEAAFVGWLANRLPVTMIDAAGNLHVDLRSEPHHRTMFTSHTDTVHNGGGRNNVHVDGDFWRAAEDSALGADDGAGIALMCHMIEAGVPGYYLFCRGEECGGIGSSWLAKNMKGVFTNIDRAVAFDRAGYDDVITHQSCGRCCSDEFADALALALTTDGDWYLPSAMGVYTDTAEFVRMVPECTNISVGYKHQHGDEEELDVPFLVRLSRQLVQLDWDTLPTKRDPKVIEHRYAKSPLAKWEGFSVSAKADDDDLLHTYDDSDEAALLYALESAQDGSHADLLELIALHAYPSDPDSIVNRLSSRRLDFEMLASYIDMLDQGFPADDILEDLLIETQEI